MYIYEIYLMKYNFKARPNSVVMALWILVYGCLLLSCSGQDLTPFIAWSNRYIY